MSEAFAVRVDVLAWAQASGAGSVEDLAAWLGVCCRDADEIAERVVQLDDELDDLSCQELSEALVRAWVGLAALHTLLDTARRQVLAAAEASGVAGDVLGDVQGLVASCGGSR